jgi:hypothetical protein
MHWLTHDAAGVFGLFQLGLFWWQLTLIRESLDDTKVAADAPIRESGLSLARVRLWERN